MKMKEFGPPGRVGASLAPPLDPPLVMDEWMSANEREEIDKEWFQRLLCFPLIWFVFFFADQSIREIQ